MILAALTWSPAGGWGWIALAAAVLLLPLAWIAVGPPGRRSRAVAVGLALRVLGVGLLVLALLDPQWSAERAKPGANLLAVVADNSASLQIMDTGETLTRGDRMRAALGGEGGGWLATLAETFQIRPHVVDRELRRVNSFDGLDFSGERSAHGVALAQLRERYAGQPLAGIIWLSDGNATDLVDGAWPDLTGLPPVYPVVLGKGEVRDARIERVTTRQTPFDDAPVTAEVAVAAPGLAGQALEISVRPLGDTAAPAEPPPARRVTPRGEQGVTPPATLAWRPAGGGVQFYEVAVNAAGGAELEEATQLNNRRALVLDRGRATYRILYVGGRPGWEFKFLNRALAEDPQLDLVGLLRVARREPNFEFRGRAGEASNPMFRGFEGADEAPRYDQPVLARVNVRDAAELRGGFPRTAEELFTYDAVILHVIEANFFTSAQLTLLRRFVAERGGGLAMLGGADSFETGGYADTPLAAALPLYLDRRGAAPSGDLRWRLTREGWLEPWVRIHAVETDERLRLDSLGPIRVAHGLASVKPGATVLANLEDESGQTWPALTAQRFGAGRVAALGAGDLWRQGMVNPAAMADLGRLWRQLARWLVTDVPARVTLRADPDANGGTRLLVTARDAEYRPIELSRATLTIRRFDSAAATGEATGFSSVTLTPEPVAQTAGVAEAIFVGRDPGAYRATVDVNAPDGTVIGRAEAGWVLDPAAEELRRLAPNRAALAELARRTGGEVLTLDDLAGLAARLPQSAAPVTETYAVPVWHHASVFLAVLGCFVAEWLWRRWRGLP